MRACSTVLLLVWLSSPGRPAAAGSESTTVFELAGQGGIIVSAVLNGTRPVRLLLDTGASHSVLVEHVAAELDAPTVATTTVVTPVGASTRRVVRIRRLDFGPIGAANIEPSVVDAIDEGRALDGLIGQDVLAAWRYTLDFKRRHIAWHADGPLPGDRKALRMERRDGRFLVALRHDSGVLRLVPDSGAGGLVLFRRPGDLLPEHNGGAEGRVTSLGGTGTARHTRVPTLRVGPVTLRNVPAIVLPRPDARGAHGDGLLPLHLFERVTFDGPAGVLIVG